MEQIKINTDAKNKRISDETARLIKEIIDNANCGRTHTEMYIPDDIATEVVEKLEKQLNQSNTNFRWRKMGEGTNPLIPTQHWSKYSELIGDNRHRELILI